MPHDPTDLRNRTKSYALRMIKLYQTLSKSGKAQVIGKQILHSGTSVGGTISGGLPRKIPGRFYQQDGRQFAGAGRDRILAGITW